MEIAADVYLQHYGTRGMKWGVRKQGSSDQTDYRSTGGRIIHNILSADTGVKVGFAAGTATGGNIPIGIAAGTAATLLGSKLSKEVANSKWGHPSWISAKRIVDNPNTPTAQKITTSLPNRPVRRFSGPRKAAKIDRVKNAPPKKKG